MDKYDKFIFLSKEAEENISQLTDAQLNFMADRIKNAILDAEYKLREEYNEECKTK